jgi:hypothetical protein
VNIVWPALFLGSRLWTPWVIAVSLVVEFLVVTRVTGAKPSRAALMTLTMNAISTLIGSIAVAALGLAWEGVADYTLYRVADVDAFNPLTWTISCVMGAFVNASIETASLRFIFKTPATRRLFWCLVFTNSITVALATLTLVLDPHEMLRGKHLQLSSLR